MAVPDHVAESIFHELHRAQVTSSVFVDFVRIVSIDMGYQLQVGRGCKKVERVLLFATFETSTGLDLFAVCHDAVRNLRKTGNEI